jgi:ADP-ribosylglycohydrolase
VKNGIYGEMYIAAMIAAAAVTNDMHTVIETGLAYIPAKSRLTEEIRYIVGLYDGGMGALDIIEEIHKKYNEHSAHDWCSTIANAMIVTMALLCGEGDFGRSICLAVQSAFDTDCNGATVGSILGMALGAKALPEKWTGPLNDRLASSVDGFHLVQLSEMAKRTVALIEK